MNSRGWGSGNREFLFNGYSFSLGRWKVLDWRQMVVGDGWSYNNVNLLDDTEMYT